MYELHFTSQSRSVVPQFEERWNAEKTKLDNQKLRKRDCNSSTAKDIANDDTDLANGIETKEKEISERAKTDESDKKEKDKTDKDIKDKKDEDDDKPGVSIVKVLLKIFGVDYLIGILWNFFTLFLDFCNPVLLR